MLSCAAASTRRALHFLSRPAPRACHLYIPYYRCPPPPPHTATPPACWREGACARLCAFPLHGTGRARQADGRTGRCLRHVRTGRDATLRLPCINRQNVFVTTDNTAYHRHCRGPDQTCAACPSLPFCLSHLPDLTPGLFSAARTPRIPAPAPRYLFVAVHRRRTCDVLVPFPHSRPAPVAAYYYTPTRALPACLWAARHFIGRTVWFCGHLRDTASERSAPCQYLDVMRRCRLRSPYCCYAWPCPRICCACCCQRRVFFSLTGILFFWTLLIYDDVRRSTCATTFTACITLLPHEQRAVFRARIPQRAADGSANAPSYRSVRRTTPL